jgi:phage shock protein C
MLGGVAGGLAEYLEVDATLVRLAFAALVLAAGAGFLGYVIAWIVIPEEPERADAYPVAAAPAADRVPPPARSARARGARLVIGVILVVIGAFLLLDWALPDLHHYLWPAAIIVLGLGLLSYGARR